MKILKPSLSPMIGLLLTVALANRNGLVEGLAIHGSGTSNPARCYGYVMETMQARSKLPLRFTYRSVGSSIGLEEFINEGNPTRSALDFGSGEIPLSHEEWTDFQKKNVTVLHLPALFGAVSFFHSVPDTPNLNLTSCLLARIFMRDITDWAHPDIREINPDLSKLFDVDENFDSLGASLRIRVARREEGSSNTNAITQVCIRNLFDGSFSYGLLFHSIIMSNFLLISFSSTSKRYDPAVPSQGLPSIFPRRNGGTTS